MRTAQELMDQYGLTGEQVKKLCEGGPSFNEGYKDDPVAINMQHREIPQELLEAHRADIDRVQRKDFLDKYRMLEALKKAYRKHVNGDDDIGWHELGNELHAVLCEVMGDEAFILWNEDKGCNHEWIDASNEKIKGGEFCPKCFAVRPTSEVIK